MPFTRLLALIVALFAPVVSIADGPPETLFINGAVVTLTGPGDSTVAEALAIAGDRIAAVGSTANLSAMAGPDTMVIDLEGKALLPGFIDAHGHFPSSGLIEQHFVDLNSPPIGGVTTIDEMITALAAKATRTPAGEWIQGRGYDDTLITEMRHPTRWDLDKVSTEHPIYIGHISGHLSVANSLALKMAGITRDSPQPFGGKIRMDKESGEPTGVLEEPPAMGQVGALLPQFSQDDMINAVAAAANEYAAVGVTTAQQGATGPNGAEVFVKAYKQGVLPIRVHVWPVLQAMVALIENGGTLDQPNANGMVTIRAVKGFADGSIQGYTGYLSQPYHSHSHNDPRYRGYPRMDREALAKQITTVHSAGYQIAIHGNGDAAIDDVLYAFDQALAASPRDDARHIIIHAQMAREDQLDRMAIAGIIPSFFNMHTYYWGDRHWNIFMGPERAAQMSPAASAVKRNMAYTLHADTPVVPMEPMRIVWSAVNRVSSGGRVIGADQRISVIEALKGITTYAAYQAFEEKDKGTLEPGKLADLVVLERNPLTVPPLELADIPVVRTIVGGRTVYER
ncbi:MAG: amidohydrolase family protein [Alphaproteobacteria bacterium]|nr:amidohydrolase family protein [Alphaproteobacteria bacterium]